MNAKEISDMREELHEARRRLAALDAQAMEIIHMFGRFGFVCGGASILTNLEMLLLDFKRCSRSEHELRKLKDRLLTAASLPKNATDNELVAMVRRGKERA